METTRAKRRLATSPFKQPVPAPIKTFEVGGRVSHDKEGIGRITAVEGAEAVVVDLGKGRLLRVMAPFHKLHKL